MLRGRRSLALEPETKRLVRAKRRRRLRSRQNRRRSRRGFTDRDAGSETVLQTVSGTVLLPPHIRSIRLRSVERRSIKSGRTFRIELPRNRMIVITGVSGSGKSSLAFDTIYAEGQRRYVESLSAYARQFLARMAKPDVESITGLAPAIAIEQKTITKNPRSTVGTTTEVYDYLRLLYARIGRTFCKKVAVGGP